MLCEKKFKKKRLKITSLFFPFNNMRKISRQTNKPRGFDLHEVALDRIACCKTSYGGIVSFPDIFLAIGRSMQLKKQDVWNLLFLLQKRGRIKIIRFKGVIVK